MKRFKLKLKNIVLTGRYYSLRIRFLAKSLPFKNPPILLLSYPRSGSSWIGKVLSASKSVAYLREPITKPYLNQKGGKYALVDINKDTYASSIYKELSDDAFQGIPPIHFGVVNKFSDFSIFRRSRKHLLIKEVNPKAAHLYCKNYDPKILLLLRHPAAVALSFLQQGWLESPDTQLDTANPNASVWEKFGFAYGSTMKCALEIINNRLGCAVIKYEDLAMDPHRQFKEIFKLIGLEIPNDYEEIIHKYCYSRKEIQKPSQTERKSKDMIYKWSTELSHQQILWLREGFVLSGLKFYSDDADWNSY